MIKNKCGNLLPNRLNISNYSELLSSYKIINIIRLCVSSSFATNIIKKEIKKNKKILSSSTKIYTPCECLDPKIFKKLKEVLVYCNDDYIIFKGKINANDYLYDFFPYNHDILMQCLDQMKLISESKINVQIFTNRLDYQLLEGMK